MEGTMTLLDTLFRRSERNRTIRNLMALDDHLLADIGVTRSDLYDMMHDRRRDGRHVARGHE
jgi:uncharacterized protein YjiS (DUF1127 family)